MDSLVLFLKGLAVGLGKIIPGVSGSLIAVTLNIYEKSIEALHHLKDDFWRSVQFLFPIGLGVILSAMLFSKLIIYLLTNHYLITMFLFIGFIAGTVPSLKKETSLDHFFSIFCFTIAFLIPLLLPYLEIGSEFQGNYEFLSLIYIFILGFIDALTMVIPGVSGTAIFMMLGSYNFVMSLFANPFLNILFTILFSLGMIFGVFLVSKMVLYLMKRNHMIFSSIVFGLLLSSLFCLFKMVALQITFANIWYLALIFFLGFFIVKKIS